MVAQQIAVLKFIARAQAAAGLISDMIVTQVAIARLEKQMGS